MEQSTKQSYSERLGETWGDQLHPVYCSMRALSELIHEAGGAIRDSEVGLGIAYFLAICAERIETAIQTCTDLENELKDKEEEES